MGKEGYWKALYKREGRNSGRIWKQEGVSKKRCQQIRLGLYELQRWIAGSEDQGEAARKGWTVVAGFFLDPWGAEARKLGAIATTRAWAWQVAMLSLVIH